MNLWSQRAKPILVLSPMEDVTDYVFREIVATQLPQPDVYYTEFTSAGALANPGGRASSLAKLRFSENQRPIVAQFWGTSPDQMYQAAALAAELKFDGVDINMGCPDKNVVKHGAGAGLIRTPKLAAEIIAAVRAGAGTLAVSVKTRLGVDKDVSETWIPFLLTQHIDALTLHARIAVDMSKGRANWDKIGRAVAWRDTINTATQIIGNGDIRTVEQARKMQVQHRVDGVMIARGIFYNPWVFEYPPQTHGRSEYIAVLRKHLQLYTETYGKTRNYEAMKKFYKMYIKDFDGANALRQQLMDTKNSAEALALLP